MFVGFIIIDSNMKCRFIILFVTFLMSFLALETLHAQNLVLWHPDGSTTDVELYTQPHVLFIQNKVVITSSVLDMEYDKSDIVRFTYKGKDTGISSNTKKTDFEQKDNKIILHNVRAVDKVAIYKSNGIRLPVHIIHDANDVILSLSSIPSGIYLLSVNGRTSKFTKL